MILHSHIKTILVAAALAAATLTALPGATLAADDPVYTRVFSDLAVGGYDPVAYFTQGEPVKGSKAFTLEYQGATWRFSSQETLTLFKGDPAAYAPQYGGYCAWAVSQGYTASGSPKNWRIVSGKLYLNYNDKVQKTWNQDPKGFIERAEANWPSVLD